MKKISSLYKLAMSIAVVTATLPQIATAEEKPLGWVNKTNGAGQKVEILAWSDGLRRDKYSVIDMNDKQRYWWYAENGSANSGSNNGPRPTTTNEWCRVRDLYGDSVNIPACMGGFMYNSYLITGLNNIHYEVWYSPSSISYYKFREQETGIWYAHDGSRNDGKLNTSKEDWCRIILYHGNGIIVPPQACNDVKSKIMNSFNATASTKQFNTEMLEAYEIFDDNLSFALDPKGYIVDKSIGLAVDEVVSSLGISNDTAAGKIANLGLSTSASTAIATAMAGGGPAAAAAALATSLAIEGTKELIKASDDTTLHMVTGFTNNPRFDLDLNWISDSWGMNKAAPGTTIPDPFIQINASKLCLDSHANTAEQNGGYVQLHACNSSRYQNWTRKGKRLINGFGMCLDAHSGELTKNGGKVILWQCTGAKNQEWEWNGNTLVNLGGNFCLDVDTSRKHQSNGSPVQLWSCAGGGNQEWSRRK